MSYLFAKRRSRSKYAHAAAIVADSSGDGFLLLTLAKLGDTLLPSAASWFETEGTAKADAYDTLKIREADWVVNDDEPDWADAFRDAADRAIEKAADALLQEPAEGNKLGEVTSEASADDDRFCRTDRTAQSATQYSEQRPTGARRAFGPTHLSGFRVFADHYQFYLHDESVEPYEVDEQWNDLAVARGSIAGKSVIHIGTKAHLNDHWIDIFAGSPPDGHDAEIVHKLSLDLPSGRLKLSTMSPDPSDPVFNFAPGNHQLTILGFNRGMEDDASHELDDAAFSARRDLERYEVYVETTE